jgi:pimeloyl-ACP methyl ester carboxylesterase/DNA-binding CsgD family transcriptional regulator
MWVKWGGVLMDQNWKLREIEILRLLAQGLTNGEIASRLHLSQETVRWYNKQIFEKLGASNRTQAVQRAGEQNLLKSGERGAESKKPNVGALRYVSNGGIHIAYKIIGEGPVDLLFIHGFLSNLEIAFEEPDYTNFFERLGKFARVILFDKRGMGLSDRIQGAPSLEDTMNDALCVLDAAASTRTFVVGTSEGGAVSVLLASTNPERVRGLILYSSTPKLVKTNGEPDWADDEDAFERGLIQIREQWGGPWGLQNFAPSRAQDENFRNWWAKVLRSSTSPSEASAVLKVLRDIDIRPLLPQIHTRTLVMHKIHDRILDVGASRYFASHMPNAKYVELNGSDHFFFVDSERIVAEIEAFMREEPDASADTWIGIILHLQLPDAGKSETTIRAESKEHRAKGVFFSKDEATAVFDSPSRAIQCALKLRDLIKDPALNISLHVGECSLENNKPTHTVIETARRAGEMATDGRIIVTQTLRDILAGSGVVFDLRQVQIGKKKSESEHLYTLT